MGVERILELAEAEEARLLDELSKVEIAIAMMRNQLNEKVALKPKPVSSSNGKRAHSLGKAAVEAKVDEYFVTRGKFKGTINTLAKRLGIGDSHETVRLVLRERVANGKITQEGKRGKNVTYRLVTEPSRVTNVEPGVGASQGRLAT